MPTRRGRPDVVVAYGGVTAVAVVTGDCDGNGTHTIGVVYARSDGQLEWQLRNANTAGAPDVVSIAPGSLGLWVQPAQATARHFQPSFDRSQPRPSRLS